MSKNGRLSHPKMDNDLPKMAEGLTQIGRQPYPKWKTISPKINNDLPKMAEELTQIGRQPYPKMVDTIPKIEDQLSEHLRVGVAYFPCGQ